MIRVRQNYPSDTTRPTLSKGMCNGVIQELITSDHVPSDSTIKKELSEHNQSIYECSLRDGTIDLFNHISVRVDSESTQFFIELELSQLNSRYGLNQSIQLLDTLSQIRIRVSLQAVSQNKVDYTLFS